MFRSKQKQAQVSSDRQRLPEFAYIDDGSIYMDSACQAVRPQPVLDTLQEYYTTYNACGGRVKYEWGRKVDDAVAETRESVLKLLGVSGKEYVVSFTLNTTMGLNLLLQQLPTGVYKQVITTDIEHNSAFLPTMALASRLGVPRKVLERASTGEVTHSPAELEGAVVVVNAVSNIDGRICGNLNELIRDTHSRGGIVIVDAAQAMAHHHELLRCCGADAICFSGHKMYAVSLGVVVARRQLLSTLQHTIVGGGMVQSVGQDSFELLADDPASWLEPGLQAWGEIISLNSAIQWLASVRPGGKSRHDHLQTLSQELYDGLKALPNIRIFNDNGPSPVISLHSPAADAHQLAIYLSAAGIMVRSGYFCCHYYLHNKLDSPPLLRFSLGLHTTSADIQKTLQTLQKLTGKGPK